MSSARIYRPDIDGLRAIAVLAVVAYHAAPGRLSGGFVGVDIFFVISGFLISSILLSSLENGSFSILDFYGRRVRRIFPALLIVMSTCALAGWFLLLPADYEQLGKHIAGGAVFVSNFTLWSESGYFDTSAIFKPLLHLWSLGIEEQFYIFWPIILWIAYKKRCTLPLTILTMVACSFALNVYLTKTSGSSAFYLPFPRFWELLAGALLACSTRMHGRLYPAAVGHALSLAGLLLLAFSFTMISEKSAFPGWLVLLPVTASVFLISAGPESLVNHYLLSNRFMVLIGLISYPLYLWHWPILSFMRAMEGGEVLQYMRVIAVVLSFVLAWMTYRLIEIPARHSSRRKSLVFRLLLGMAALGIFGVLAATTHGFKDRSGSLPKVVNSGDIGHDSFFAYINANFFPCTPDYIRKEFQPEEGVVRCYQSRNDREKSIALIGDSHAEHLFIGISEALPEENVVFYPTDGLPVVSNENLDKVFKLVMEDPKIKSVFLNAIWARKVNDARFSAWQDELQATVAALTASGKSIFIADDVPSFDFFPSRCKFSDRLGIDNLCHEADKMEYKQYRPIFDKIALVHANVHVVRTYDAFCANGTCSMAANGQLYYRDDNHLNVNGSKAVGKEIGRQIRAGMAGTK